VEQAACSVMLSGARGFSEWVMRDKASTHETFSQNSGLQLAAPDRGFCITNSQISFPSSPEGQTTRHIRASTQIVHAGFDEFRAGVEQLDFGEGRTCRP
jgi:hypothetical protein